MLLSSRTLGVCLAFVLLLSASTSLHSQLRKVYSDNLNTDNDIQRVSFYSPSHGYVASTGASNDWVGFTADSGRTIIKKPISSSNVDYNNFPVNTLFPFAISGVEAIDQNNLIAYGHYGFEPTILKSTDGGSTFKVVFNSVFNSLFSTIYDMSFPQNNLVGFATDGFRILKTTNGGENWNVVYSSTTAGFGTICALNNSNVFVSSDIWSNDGPGKLVKTTTGGLIWEEVIVPGQKIESVEFITPNKGWINIYQNLHSQVIYYTSDGGLSWVLKNDPEAHSVRFARMKFIDENVGFAIGLFTFDSYKTTNGGKIWERMKRDNDFEYLAYGHKDIELISANQFWLGGARDLIEISTNAGGVPYPASLFLIDTTGYYHGNLVSLKNHSRSDYTYKWFVNGSQISTNYNASYIRTSEGLSDTITLIVSNGVDNDTLTQYAYFYPRVKVLGFNPSFGGPGSSVTITGQNFSSPVSVSFGGVPATVNSVNSTSIIATLGNGASGQVKVRTSMGQDSLSGFSFVPKPEILSFSPTSGSAGTTITIFGNSFIGVNEVKIAGIPVSFNVISESNVTAIAPSGPSGSIILTTIGGSDTIDGYISIPVLESFTPTQGTYGTVMSITGTSLSETSDIKVGGVNVLSFEVISSTFVKAVVGSGASGDVTLTTPGGTTTLSGFTWVAPPEITSFSPVSGPIGTSVTITGSGFDPTLGGNKVYFGSVRAEITAATATSLSVIVPPGSTFEQISVLTNNLFDHTSQPFLVTFPGSGVISDLTFSTREVIAFDPPDVLLGINLSDLDQDGNIDIMVPHYASGAYAGVLVYRNTSTSSSLSFDSVGNFGSIHYKEVRTGDFDGDGFPDMVISGDNTIGVYRNISTPGSILIESTSLNLPTGNSPKGMVIGDVDGDGKLDIVVNHYPNQLTRVYRNISEPGAIAFASGVDFPVQGGRNIILADLNDDAKPELIVPHSVGNQLSVFRNTSIPGNVSFQIQNFTGYSHSNVGVGDIDGDGKVDIVSGEHNGSNVAVYRNISSGGSINFSTPITFPAIMSPTGIALSDIDGDGKLDITLALANLNMGVIKNNSTPGNFLLEPVVGFTPGSFLGEHYLQVGDLNGDGKCEVVVVSEVAKEISIYLNSSAGFPFVESFAPSIGEAGTAVTITGANFNGITEVKFGGVDAASFTVNSPTEIIAIVGSGATGAVSVGNSFGTHVTDDDFIFGAPPVITSFSPESGPAGTSIVIAGNNFDPVPEGNIVYFGGKKAQVISATSTSLTVKVPTAGTQAPITVTSNNRTAYSQKHFSITFQGGTEDFGGSSFAPPFAIRGVSLNGCLVDLDMDGQLDAVGVNETKLGIMRNTSITGSFSFAPVLEYSTPFTPSMVRYGDFDSDGIQDLVILNGQSTISIVKNLSTPGNLVFGDRLDIPVSVYPTSPNSIVVRDIDDDGRPDIILSNFSFKSISVYRNITLGGTISFASPTTHIIGGNGNGVAVGDLDGDGKSDIVAATSSTGTVNELEFLRNIGTPGVLQFAAGSQVPGLLFPTLPVLGDLDGDDKFDCLASVITGQISLYLNSSNTGSISFQPRQSFPTGGNIVMAIMNDLNGDGKLDLIAPSYQTNKIAFFKNSSTVGNIQLSPRFDYQFTPGVISPSYIDAADMDGDGKPDVVLFGGGPDGFVILRNQIGGAGPALISFDPISVDAGGTVTIKGANLADVTSVSFGGVEASSFNIISPNSIEAVVANGSSGNVEVSSPKGMSTLAGFIFGNKPIITSIEPPFGLEGSIVTINGANFQGVTEVSFGGTQVASYSVVSQTQINAVLANGASGEVQVISTIDTAKFENFPFYYPPIITSFTPTIGGGGTTITINGDNFIPTTSVKVGGVEVEEFTVLSSDSIRARKSEGASGEISVTTPAGTAALGEFTDVNGPDIRSIYPASATTGMTVHFFGWNFTHVNDVKFGGVPALSFTVLSADHMSAVVGNGASGDIVATNLEEGSTYSGFTYIPSTIPVITSISPSVVSHPGDEVTISGHNFVGITSVSFGGVAATSFVVNSPNSITAILGNGNSGDVTVTSSGGSGSLSGFVFTAAPIITSFEPVIANNGSLVTITGRNFNPTPASNIVFFGTAKAVVTAATPTSLSVIVPTGANHSHISVMNDGLTGYSIKRFLPTYNGDGQLTETNFSTRIDSTSQYGPAGVRMADFDLDGRQDLIVPNDGYPPHNFTLYRNTSTQGEISFAKRDSFHVNINPRDVGIADIDGDGRLDLITPPQGSGFGIEVRRNISSVGSLEFDDPVQIAGTLASAEFVTADFDGDGKTDVASLLYQFGAVRVFRNTSTIGSISFEGSLNFGSTITAKGIITEDLDGDGKRDILVVGSSSPEYITILRNTSSPGSLSFTVKTIRTPATGFDFATADIDADGKPEIICGQPWLGKFAIYKNTSFPGYINFHQFVTTVPTLVHPGDISVGDYNGDGKADIAILDRLTNTLAVHSNRSIPGNISIDPAIFYTLNGEANGLIAGDIDGDGITDLITSIPSSNSVSVLRNTPASGSAIVTVPFCSDGDISITSGLSGLTYQWQQNTGSGFVDLVNNSSFGGVNTVTLEIFNIPGNWNGYEFRCMVNGSDSSHTYKLMLSNSIIPEVLITASPQDGCIGTNMTFTATSTNGGSSPVYQWQVNGANVGINSITFNSSSLQNDDEVKVIMTSNASCASPATIESNTIVVSLTPLVTPAISISTTTDSICAGATVYFESISLNAGDDPSYEWFVNGVSVGNDTTYFSNTGLIDGSQVYAVLTSSAECSSALTDTSNIITISVSPSLVPAVSILASASAICSGDEVSFFATPVNGGDEPHYQWFVNGIDVGNDNDTLTATFTNASDVYVVMNSNADCITQPSATSNIVNLGITTSVIPEVSIMASSSTICEGETITFSAQSVNGGSSPIFQWMVNGSPVGSNSNTYSSSSLTNGSEVSVLMTSSLGCASPVNTLSNLITISVTANLTPAVTIAASTNDICEGTEVIFTAAPTNGGASPSYQWQLNGSNVGTNSETFSADYLEDSDVISVIMTSGLQCLVSPTATSNLITMNVDPVVSPEVSITASTLQSCIGEEIVFTANSLNAGSTPAYQWQVDNVNVGNNSSTFATSSLMNGSGVLVIMTSSMNCLVSSADTSNTLVVSIQSEVVPEVSITGMTAVERGQSSDITSTNTNGGVTPQYQWQDSTRTHGWNPIAGGVHSSITYTPDSTGDKIRCILFSSENCANPDEVVSNVLVFAVAEPPVSGRVRYYPNPVNSTLTLDSLSLDDEWQSAEIVDTEGRRMISVNIQNQTSRTINVSMLRAGQYFVVLRGNAAKPVYIKIIKF